MISPANPLVFLHIPRTGGTSLISYLDSQFATDQICPVHEQLEFERLQSEKKLSGYSLYRGHFGINFERFVPAASAWVTFLRQPGPRVYSSWMHLRRQPLPSAGVGKQPGRMARDVANARACDFSEFCERVMQEGRLSFFNQMTVILGIGRGWDMPEGHVPVPDEAMLERAKRSLERHFFVGLTERFDESCRLLQASLGMPAAILPRLNGTEWIEAQTRDLRAPRLGDLCRFDAALYEYGRSLFANKAG